MRILLDECVNPRVKRAFTGHDVRTVAEVGWRTIEDRPLLELVQGNFDVFVTIDRSLEYQQNLRKLDFGIVIVHVPKNRIACYEPIFGQILAAAEDARPGRVLHVRSPALDDSALV